MACDWRKLHGDLYMHSLLTYKFNVPFIVISFFQGGGGMSHALCNFMRVAEQCHSLSKEGEGVKNCQI